MEAQEEWEKRLVSEGLSMSTGHNPHLMFYGHSISQLDALPQNTMAVPAFQTLVELTLQESSGNAERNGRMKKLRANRSSAKQRLKEKIWGAK